MTRERGRRKRKEKEKREKRKRKEKEEGENRKEKGERERMMNKKSRVRERGSLSLSCARYPFPPISSQILHFLGTRFPGSRKMCYPGSNQEKVNKNCPSVRRGKLKTMNVIREEIRANLCWLSLVIGQRSVVLCFTVTGCETIEATADTGRMLLPLPSNEKKSWQASKM